MMITAMNNDKNAKTAMTPNPEMDSDSSWIEKWMDMNGIFDPNCDHLASDIDLPLLCEVNVADRINNNASNNSANNTDSNDKNDDYHDDSNADQIIPTNTVYSQISHGSPQQTNLMTMINTPPSSNDTIHMNFDPRNHSPSTVQCSPSSMVCLRTCLIVFCFYNCWLSI
ncbi:unnamed protein product [Anisakis simplex]|uniref:GATA zinc finger domain-containing protein 14-like n=1 Tax=Anisakis simplex TaxID=6269 RepID=A0A0M3JK13_ANISI|nr:unnamed protein product [Anisakis simplex]